MDEKISAKKKRGGQPGNRNAVGNRGGPGHPAPKGNKYAVVTGEYETIRCDDLAQGAVPMSERERLLDQYRLLYVRVRRMMARQQAVENAAKGHMILTKAKHTASKSVYTYTNVELILLRQDEAITRVQSKIIKIAMQLHRIKMEAAWLALEREKNKRDEGVVSS